MTMFSKNLWNKILDAPVGQVVNVLGEILDCDIILDVIEQKNTSPTQFVRKVSITAQRFPVIKADVKFDSIVLPELIMTELLKKKQGVGDILNSKNINAARNLISLNHNHFENKITREYEIIHNGVVWFTIIEEIRLGGFGSDNNS